MTYPWQTPKQEAEVVQMTDIDHMSQAILTLKETEAQARSKRLELESQMLEFFSNKEEGSESTKGKAFKVTVTKSMDRKIVDPQGLAEAIDAELWAGLVRTKYELNTKDLKSIQKFSPSQYATIAQFIEMKPRKPSVRVEPLQ